MGLRYLDEINKIQSLYYKKLLNLPKHCPNYAVRLEVGALPLEFVEVIKRTLNWLSKMINMDDNRLPKICLNKFLSLSTDPNVKAKYNWCTRLNDIITSHFPSGMASICREGILKNNISDILDKYKIFLHDRDKMRILNSSLPILPYVESHLGRQPYLDFNIPMKIIEVQTCNTSPPASYY